MEFREDRKRHPRPRSASYIAVRNALFQLTSLSDFATEKIGAGFYADVFKVPHSCGPREKYLALNANKARWSPSQFPHLVLVRLAN